MLHNFIGLISIVRLLFYNLSYFKVKLFLGLEFSQAQCRLNEHSLVDEWLGDVRFTQSSASPLGETLLLFIFPFFQTKSNTCSRKN
jgi:hypothetical protein